MPATLTIHDQTASGDTINSVPIEFPSERITVRELIRERVYQEVQDYNRKTDPPPPEFILTSPPIRSGFTDSTTLPPCGWSTSIRSSSPRSCAISTSSLA
jgi:hypothetical protein